jgi:hypothetical protein
VSESALLKKFILEYSKIGSRLFRANSGMAWTGRTNGPERSISTVVLQPGDLVIRSARPFHGMIEGTPDLIGWTVVKVTEEMVGKSLAVYTAFEVKTEGVRTTSKQAAFIRTVNSFGGIAAIVKKLEDLIVAVASFKGVSSDEHKH